MSEVNANKPGKRRLLNSLSKKLIIMFIIMTILISCASCVIGYLKYSSTIKQLYNENSYSIAHIVQGVVTPEMGDFLESLIVYKTDANGNYILNEYGKKIPKMVNNNGTISAEVNLDMYADRSTLSGEELEKYDKYYGLLDQLDLIKEQSGAKYIILLIQCDGDTIGDPYYVKGQKKYSNPYAVYFADARYDDKTLNELGLSDEGIIETAKSLGVDLKKEDIRDEYGRVYDDVYNNFCRLGLGMQTRLNSEVYEDGLNVFLTGEKSDNYFEVNNEYGMTTEAVLPIRNSKGEIFGILSVDVEMSIIRSTLKNYVFSAILATVGLVVLFMLVMLIIMNIRVIKPIKNITKATSEFVGGDMVIDESLEKIKTGDEIENLASAVHKMSVDLVEYVDNLASITAEKERIGAELNVATQIQASMLPCIFPPYPDRDEFDIFATMTPAKEVGGDFYDFFMIDEDNVAIVMADVSGKGVPAALFMVIAKTLIKDHSQTGKDLGKVFSDVNELLCEANSQGLFVTAFEGVLNLKTGEFRFVNAGHEMPFICHNNEKYEAYKIRPGFVLAGMEGMRYKSGSITLEPGDKIFQYTDGVTEATNKDNELYGMERLEKILTENADKDPYELLPNVKADIDKFVAEAPQFDDITMLCLEYKKRGEENA